MKDGGSAFPRGGGVIFSNGFVYRWGQRIKEFGERIGCCPVLRLFSGPVIGLGLRIRDRALGMTAPRKKGKNLIKKYKSGARDFTGADLKGALLGHAVLSGAHLHGAGLFHAVLCFAGLSDADLSCADLRGAYLCGAELTGANLSGAVMRGADLTGAGLTSARLTGANLFYAVMRDADLRGADLSRANLCHADLRGADLTDARLSNADLRDANLDGADLANTDLTDAAWPLSRGSLDVKTDRRMAAQLAYHFCRLDCDAPGYIQARNALVPFANTSHLVNECGALSIKEHVQV